MYRIAGNFRMVIFSYFRAPSENYENFLGSTTMLIELYEYLM